MGYQNTQNWMLIWNPWKRSRNSHFKTKHVSAYFLFCFIFPALFPITIFVLYELVCNFLPLLNFQEHFKDAFAIFETLKQKRREAQKKRFFIIKFCNYQQVWRVRLLKSLHPILQVHLRQSKTSVEIQLQCITCFTGRIVKAQLAKYGAYCTCSNVSPRLSVFFLLRIFLDCCNRRSTSRKCYCNIPAHIPSVLVDFVMFCTS
jgi:hypothetical protein